MPKKDKYHLLPKDLKKSINDLPDEITLSKNALATLVASAFSKEISKIQTYYANRYQNMRTTFEHVTLPLIAALNVTNAIMKKKYPNILNVEITVLAIVKALEKIYKGTPAPLPYIHYFFRRERALTRVHLSNLKNKGYVTNPRENHYSVTPEGRKVLNIYQRTLQHFMHDYSTLTGELEEDASRVIKMRQLVNTRRKLHAQLIMDSKNFDTDSRDTKVSWKNLIMLLPKELRQEMIDEDFFPELEHPTKKDGKLFPPSKKGRRKKNNDK